MNGLPVAPVVDSRGLIAWHSNKKQVPPAIGLIKAFIATNKPFVYLRSSELARLASVQAFGFH